MSSSACAVGIVLFSFSTFCSIVRRRAAMKNNPTSPTSINEIVAEIDDIFTEHLKSENIPGCVYGIIVYGKLVCKKTFGVQSIGASGLSVSLDSRFRIASMTKSFTAMAILHLRDNGALSLSELVEKYVPEVFRMVGATSDSPRPTIRQLLAMEGGIPQDDPWADRLLGCTDDELMSIISSGLVSSSTVGTSFEYSNLGYAILGLLIKRVSGISYQEYITEKILLPLGMKDTVFEFNRVPTEKLALGYRWEENMWKIEPMLHDGAVGSMGGLITTIDDFAKYVCFHLSAWPPSDLSDDGPVRRSSVREMHQLTSFIAVSGEAGNVSPTAAGYGYGLVVNTDTSGITSVRHAGGLPGFGSEYRFLPKYGAAVISFANRTYAGMHAPNLKVMKLLLSRKVIKPRELSPSPILTQRAAQLAQVLAGDWSDANLCSEVFCSENFFLDKPKRLWVSESKKALGQIGGYASCTAVVPTNILRGTFFLLGKNGDKKIKVFFTLTPLNPPTIQWLGLTVVNA